MSIIDDILREAEDELTLDKEANDQNGGPEAPAKEHGGGDILASAQELLQQIEQFKSSLGEVAAQNSGGEGQQVDPNAPQQQQQQVQGDAAIAIIRPDGTQIKVASLMKLAALRGKQLFEEV